MKFLIKTLILAACVLGAPFLVFWFVMYMGKVADYVFYNQPLW